MVGDRLARAAGRIVYGDSGLCRSPRYKCFDVKDGRIELSFDQAAGGLSAAGNLCGCSGAPGGRALPVAVGTDRRAVRCGESVRMQRRARRSRPAGCGWVGTDRRAVRCGESVRMQRRARRSRPAGCGWVGTARRAVRCGESVRMQRRARRSRPACCGWVGTARRAVRCGESVRMQRRARRSRPACFTAVKTVRPQPEAFRSW